MPIILKENRPFSFFCFVVSHVKGGGSLEHSIVIKGMLDHLNHTKYSGIVDQIENLPKEVKLLVKTIGMYWDKYPDSKSVSEDDLLVFFQANFPRSKDLEFVKQVLDQAKEIRIENPEIMMNALNVLVYQAFMGTIVETAMAGLNKYDPAVPDQIISTLDNYKMISGGVKDPESRVFKKTMMEIIESERSINFKWRTGVIQRALGNPRPGRLHHVFGHVHSGKSAMLISESTWFARQMHLAGSKDCVMYITNEEGCEQLMPRIYAAFLGQPINMIYQFPERAETAFRANGGNYIKVIDDVGHISQVQRDVMDIRPKLLFIDQGTKVAVSSKGKTDAKHELLRQVYFEYRKLVVKYKFDIITCGQASDDCRHKKWLADRDMDGAKIGMPGELDVAIGIGRDDRDGYELVRYLHICKNRYNGTFEKETVHLDQQKVRFES